MTSSSCSSSLLVSVVFIVVLFLLKCPFQSWRRTTSKKMRAYSPASTSVLSSSSIATPLPLLPTQSSRPMNNAPMSIAGIDIVAVAGLHRRRAAAPTVVATIKRTSARRRRESSRRRWGLAPSHPLHSSSSIAVAVAVAVAVAAVAVAIAIAVAAVAVAIAVESLCRCRGRRVHRA